MKKVKKVDDDPNKQIEIIGLPQTNFTTLQLPRKLVGFWFRLWPTNSDCTECSGRCVFFNGGSAGLSVGMSERYPQNKAFTPAVLGCTWYKYVQVQTTGMR